MADEEKKSLLPSREETPINRPGGSKGYGGVASSTDEAGEKTYTRSRFMQALYDNREKIPGYGVLKMVTQGRLYSLYVLLALLAVYLLNQLDRYTLPVVTTSVGPDLRYGDKTCQANPHVNKTMLMDSGFSTKNCTAKSFQ